MLITHVWPSQCQGSKHDSEQRGQRQTAYQVLVASSEEVLERDLGDLWDSGKVESAQSADVVYEGKELVAGLHCWWKVRVWDKDSVPSYSQNAWWERGLIEDWQGQWIGLEQGLQESLEVDSDVISTKDALVPSPYLRKTIALTKPVSRASLYATARGLYEVHIKMKSLRAVCWRSRQCV